MAAAQAQLHGMVQTQQDAPLTKWNKEPLFDDTPTSDGMVRIQQATSWLHGIPRGGSSLGANVQGTDPGAGGAGNATVQAQYNDRCIASREAMLSMIKTGCGLWIECSNPPFVTGQHIYDYVKTKAYLRLDDDEAQRKILEVQSWTYLDLPSEQQNENLVLNFLSKIKGYNPLMHPNMNISDNMKIAVFCNGLHPGAKLEALKMKGNIALAQTNGCCFPAVYPAGHPQAGVAHPRANALSLDHLAMYVHRDFSRQVRAGTLRLKGQPSVNLTTKVDVEMDDASARSETEKDVSPSPPIETDNGIAYVSWTDVWDQGCKTFYDYAVYVLNRDQRTQPLRTCKNCGGVNHFSHKDGVLVCPTPEGSVNNGLLSRIRYPIGINPWRFGKGKGKGKGGKGGGRGGYGRGRGNYYSLDWHDDTSEQHAAGTEHTDSEQPGETCMYITDDFDGWNE